MMIVDAFSSSEAVGMGQSVSTAGGTSTTAKFTRRRAHQGDHRRRPRGRARLRRDRPGGRRRLPARSATTRTPTKSAATFITFDGKRYSVPGDYATVEADGTPHPARPRLGVHQHRRREGVPRGGRGGRSRPTRPSPTPWPSACPTRSSARPSPPSSSWPRAPTLDEGADHRPREGQAGRLQGARSGCCRSTPSAGPRTARSTTSASRAWAADQLGVEP